MTSITSIAQETGIAPFAVRMEEAETLVTELAGEMEVNTLQSSIDDMNAAAQRIEAEIAQMLAETGGAAESSSECATARNAARDMHCSAEDAKTKLASAPVDPKTGRKIITSNAVSNLKNGMYSIIIAAENEYTKIEKTISETQAHAEAIHAKVNSHSEDVAPRSIHIPAGIFCASAAPKQHWFSGYLVGMHGFVTQGTYEFASYWDGVTETVSGLYRDALNLHPGATIARVSAHVWNEGVSVTKNIMHGIDTRVTNVSTMIGEKWHAGKVIVANALGAINPFRDKTTEVEARAESLRPITVQPNAMDKALEQAKAIVHRLPHISLPNLSEFIPASVPSLQGVMEELHLIH